MSTLYRVPGVEMGELIGSGGMGAVYSARRVEDNTPVAVKILLREHPGVAHRKRFEREARAMMALQHPHVCRAYDFGMLDSGQLYLVLESLCGEDLGERLERVKRFSVQEALSVAEQAASGLSAAHVNGLVHRDIKPSNIYLHQPAGSEQMHAKILDFGLAVFSLGDAAETRVTRTGEVVGTPAYMSPEQARGDRSEDERSDVYSLAAVLYRMLTGIPPFGRGTAMELLVRLLTQKPRPMTELVPSIPVPLAALIHRSLAPDAADRPPSMRVFEQALAEQKGLLDPAETIPNKPLQVTRGDSGPARLTDEARVLTVVVANGVRNPQAVVAALQGRGGRATNVSEQQVVGLFGTDRRQGDEARQAVRAALEASRHAQVIGVATGRAVGRESHFSGKALGAAEEATRIMDTGVVVDVETQRQVSGYFVIEAGRVLAELSSVLTNPQSPLIGRELEVSEAKGKILRAFGDEEPVAILISGPPGVGRSRLLQEITTELSRSLHDVQLVIARADSNRRYRAWWLFGAVLREWLGLVAVSDPETIRARTLKAAQERGLSTEAGYLLAVTLGIRPPAGVSPALDAARLDAQVLRDQMVQALGDLVAHEATEKPVLIALDDVHWGDSPSLEVVDILLNRIEEGRLAIVMTGRSGEAEQRTELFGSPRIRRVKLRELSYKAATRLAVAMGVNTELAPAIARRAGGNPLFIEEIAFTVGKSTSSDEQELTAALPLTVEEAVLVRLDQLPADDKYALKVAAVFGTRFLVEGLIALGGDACALCLNRLARANLIVPRPALPGQRAQPYDFRCDVIREVAYRTLTEQQQSKMHAKAARWLLEMSFGSLAEAAEHFSKAGELSEAFPVWLRAAEAALDDRDLQAALSCLERALPMASQREDVISVRMLWLEIAATLARLDDADEQYAALEPMRADISDEKWASVLYWKAGSLRFRADYAVSTDLLEQAVTLYEQAGDLPGVSRALSSLAISRCLGNQGAGRAFAERAVKAAGNHLAARARALQAQLHVELYEGDPVALARMAADAVAACEEAGDLRRALEVLVTQAYVARRRGAHADAEARLRQVVQRSQRIGNRNAEGYALHNLGYVFIQQGRPEEGIALQERVLTMGRESGHERLVVAALVYKTLGLIALKNYAEAYQAGALALSMTEGDAEEPIALAVQALACLRLRKVEEGLTLCERVLELCPDPSRLPEQELLFMVTHAELLLGAGRFAEGRVAMEGAKEFLFRTADEYSANAAEREQYLQATWAHRRVADVTLVDP